MSHLDFQYIRTEKWKDFACTESLWYTFVYQHKCYLKIVTGEPLIYMATKFHQYVCDYAILYYLGKS